MSEDNKPNQVYTIIFDKKDKKLLEDLPGEISFRAMKLIEDHGSVKLWNKYANISFKIEFK